MNASNEDPGTGRAESGEASDQLPPRRRPPVTIDLAANPAGQETEAVVPGHAAEEEPGPAVAPEETQASESSVGLENKDDRSPPSWTFDGVSLVRLAAAALAGAIVAIVIGVALEAAGIVPTPAGREARTALAQSSQLERDIAALSASMRANVSEQQAISARLAGLETISRDLITTTEQLRSLDGLTAATEARLDQLEQAVAGLQTAVKNGTAPAGDDRIATLTSELDRLSARIEELSETPPADQRSAAAARGMAFAGLRAAAERGEPFGDELALLRLLGADPPELAELESAANGVPSRAALAGNFDAVAEAILDASTTARPDATVIERVWDQARSLVSIRPVGPIEGTTPEAVVSRMRAAVEAGDLATALAERAALPEAGKSVSAAWARDAEARIALERALVGLERAMEAAAATQ